ncbi:MAG: helix-turn-helix domain-containing protein [bacterium]|nr:helix-turn-helix domain-containing protein [bacterium]
METYKEELIKTGLNANQALIYELLIKNGSMRASRLSRLAGSSLSRPMIYALLNELVDVGLVEKEEQRGEVARFIPAHPSKLQGFAEKQQEKAAAAMAAAGSVIPKITSDYNLTTGKPGVRFFEGDTGIKAVLDDSLTAKSEIYTYADLESIEKYIPKINEEYVRERELKNIKKRGIVLDTAFNRKFLEGYHQKITDAKLIKYEAAPFQSVMQIYDNKVSYLTLGDKQKIGVIIEDPHIYAMHKYLFEYLWNITPEINSATKQYDNPLAPQNESSSQADMDSPAPQNV